MGFRLEVRATLSDNGEGRVCDEEGGTGLPEVRAEEGGEAGECWGRDSWGAGPGSSECLWLLLSLWWSRKEAGKEFSCVSFALYPVASQKTLPSEVISKNTALVCKILKQLQIPTYKEISRRWKILKKTRDKETLAIFIWFLLPEINFSSHHTSVQSATCPAIFVLAKGQERNREATCFLHIQSRQISLESKLFKGIHVISETVDRGRLDAVATSLPHVAIPPPLPPSLWLPKAGHPQQSVRNVLQHGGEIHRSSLCLYLCRLHHLWICRLG